MGLGPSNTIFRFMWRVQIYHLNLAFWVIDRPFRVILIGHYFLTAVWSFLPLPLVASVDNLLLISLKHLCWMRCVRTGSRTAKASLIIVIVHLFLWLQISNVVLRILVVPLVVDHLIRVVQHFWTGVVTLQNHSTTRSLLETDASMLGLGTQGYSILCLINLVVHLASLISTINIHGAGATANFIVSIVMLQIHGISTHSWLGLRLHVPLKLVELLRVAARLLMISMGWVTHVLGTRRTFLGFLSFQIVVWQVTNLILVLLLLVLGVWAAVVHVGAGDDILSVLNEILIARGVRGVLRGRSHVWLILISLDILG